jgi:hypothetical protein
MRTVFNRYLGCLLMVASLVFLPCALLAWWLGPIAGDLVRLGPWSERDFGWTAPQPRLAVQANGRSQTDPAVLVLGDSFSMGNVWQSELQRRTGLSTQSFGYEQAPCLDAFIRMALAPRHAAARVVVLQTIERHFLDRFEDPPACAGDAVTPFETAPGLTHAAPLPGPFTVDWRYLLGAATNTLRLARSPEAAFRTAETVNVPLTDSTLFSNRRAARLLYYAYDDAKSGWTEARLARAAARLLAIKARLRAGGKQLLVVVVPDKSSVYREFLVSPSAPVPDAVSALVREGVSAVELLAPMRAAVGSTPDLFMPDDTHLSARGFERLGVEVARWPGFAAVSAVSVPAAPVSASAPVPAPTPGSPIRP